MFFMFTLYSISFFLGLRKKDDYVDALFFTSSPEILLIFMTAFTCFSDAMRCIQDIFSLSPLMKPLSWAVAVIKQVVSGGPEGRSPVRVPASLGFTKSAVGRPSFPQFRISKPSATPKVSSPVAAPVRELAHLEWNPFELGKVFLLDIKRAVV